MQLSRSSFGTITAVVVVGLVVLIRANWLNGKRVGLETGSRFLDLAASQDIRTMRATGIGGQSAIERLKECELANGKILRWRIAHVGCQIGGNPWFVQSVVWRQKGVFLETSNGFKRRVMMHGGPEHSERLTDAEVMKLLEE